jgi:hypothetical protein
MELLKNAKVYAEGRGIRIPVTDPSSLNDIFQRIDFKLAYKSLCYEYKET